MSCWPTGVSVLSLNCAVGDRIVGTEKRGTYRHYVTTAVLAHWSTVKPAYRVTLGDGTEMSPVGTTAFSRAEAWKHVTGAMSGPDRRPYLTTNDSLLDRPHGSDRRGVQRLRRGGQP